LNADRNYSIADQTMLQHSTTSDRQLANLTLRWKESSAVKPPQTSMLPTIVWRPKTGWKRYNCSDCHNFVISVQISNRLSFLNMHNRPCCCCCGWHWRRQRESECPRIRQMASLIIRPPDYSLD